MALLIPVRLERKADQVTLEKEVTMTKAAGPVLGSIANVG